jgi:hypothetical protein
MMRASEQAESLWRPARRPTALRDRGEARHVGV